MDIKNLASIAVVIFAALSNIFLQIGYTPPIPIDKMLHMTQEQINGYVSFAALFLMPLHTSLRQFVEDLYAWFTALIAHRAEAQAAAQAKLDGDFASLVRIVAGLSAKVNQLQAQTGKTASTSTTIEPVIPQPAPESRGQVGRINVWLLAPLAAGALLFGVLFAACGTQDARNTVYASCVAYDRALEALTPMRAAHRLTADQVQAVEQARAVAGPICTGPMPTDTADALAKLSAAVASLTAVAAPASAASR